MQKWWVLCMCFWCVWNDKNKVIWSKGRRYIENIQYTIWHICAYGYTYIHIHILYILWKHRREVKYQQWEHCEFGNGWKAKTEIGDETSMLHVLELERQHEWMWCWISHKRMWWLLLLLSVGKVMGLMSRKVITALFLCWIVIFVIIIIRFYLLFFGWSELTMYIFIQVCIYMCWNIYVWGWVIVGWFCLVLNLVFCAFLMFFWVICIF